MNVVASLYATTIIVGTISSGHGRHYITLKKILSRPVIYNLCFIFYTISRIMIVWVVFWVFWVFWVFLALSIFVFSVFSVFSGFFVFWSDSLEVFSFVVISVVIYLHILFFGKLTSGHSSIHALLYSFLYRLALTQLSKHLFFYFINLEYLDILSLMCIYKFY